MGTGGVRREKVRGGHTVSRPRESRSVTRIETSNLAPRDAAVSPSWASRGPRPPLPALGSDLQCPLVDVEIRGVVRRWRVPPRRRSADEQVASRDARQQLAHVVAGRDRRREEHVGTAELADQGGAHLAGDLGVVDHRRHAQQDLAIGAHRELLRGLAADGDEQGQRALPLRLGEGPQRALDGGPVGDDVRRRAGVQRAGAARAGHVLVRHAGDHAGEATGQRRRGEQDVAARPGDGAVSALTA